MRLSRCLFVGMMAGLACARPVLAAAVIYVSPAKTLVVIKQDGVKKWVVAEDVCFVQESETGAIAVACGAVAFASQDEAVIAIAVGAMTGDTSVLSLKPATDEAIAELLLPTAKRKKPSATGLAKKGGSKVSAKPALTPNTIVFIAKDQAVFALSAGREAGFVKGAKVCIDDEARSLCGTVLTGRQNLIFVSSLEGDKDQLKLGRRVALITPAKAEPMPPPPPVALALPPPEPPVATAPVVPAKPSAPPVEAPPATPPANTTAAAGPPPAPAQTVKSSSAPGPNASPRPSPWQFYLGADYYAYSRTSFQTFTFRPLGATETSRSALWDQHKAASRNDGLGPAAQLQLSTAKSRRSYLALRYERQPTIGGVTPYDVTNTGKSVAMQFTGYAFGLAAGTTWRLLRINHDDGLWLGAQLDGERSAVKVEAATTFNLPPEQRSVLASGSSRLDTLSVGVSTAYEFHIWKLAVMPQLVLGHPLLRLTHQQSASVYPPSEVAYTGNGSSELTSQLKHQLGSLAVNLQLLVALTRF